MLQKGVDIYEYDPMDLRTPLLWAIQTNDVQLLELLITHGVDIDSKDKFGNPIIFKAMYECKSFHTIKIMLDNCPDCLVCQHSAGTMTTITNVSMPCFDVEINQVKSESKDAWMTLRDIEVVLISVTPPFSFNKGFQRRIVNIKLNTNDMMMLTSKGLILGTQLTLSNQTGLPQLPSQPPEMAGELVFTGEIVFYACTCED